MKEGIRKIINSKSKTFLTFCFCFILGSSLPTLFDLKHNYNWQIYYLICILIALMIIFWSNKVKRFFLLAILAAVFGVGRSFFSVQDCTLQNNLCFFNGERAVVEGVVSSEPNRKQNATEYYLDVSKIKFNGKEILVKGKVLLKLPSYPKYLYGDRLVSTCALQDPARLDTGDFRYDKYLERFGVRTTCFNASVKKIGEDKNIVLGLILDLKNKFNELCGRLWPEPEASLMSSILYGARSGLPSDVNEAFGRTGLSHIMAVSGYNITIIIALLMSILISAGLYRQQAYYAVLLLTVLFVVFSGFSASAVRAAVMGIVALTAVQVGRGSRVFNVLAFTAALMLLFNPYLLFWDAGFQLSFLATLGLVYFSNNFDGKMKIFPGLIREPLATTLSAIILTAPLMLYQFGSLSIVAPLANVLVLWIVPYLMMVGAMALFVGAIYLPLGKIIAFVGHLGLKYILILVEFFSAQKWSSVQFKMPLLLMLAVYLVLFKVMYEKNKST